jgi:hypothetical protein
MKYLQHILIFLLVSVSINLVGTQNQPPALIVTFFKRFTSEMGSAPVWTFVTKKITAGWGHCIINNDEIITTIGEETVSWSVPGGPWQIYYYTQEEHLELLSQGKSPGEEKFWERSRSPISSKAASSLSVRSVASYTQEEVIKKALDDMGLVLLLSNQDTDRIIAEVSRKAHEADFDKKAILRQLQERIKEKNRIS